MWIRPGVTLGKGLSTAQARRGPAATADRGGEARGVCRGGGRREWRRVFRRRGEAPPGAPAKHTADPQRCRFWPAHPQSFSLSGRRLRRPLQGCRHDRRRHSATPPRPLGVPQRHWRAYGSVGLRVCRVWVLRPALAAAACRCELRGRDRVCRGRFYRRGKAAGPRDSSPARPWRPKSEARSRLWAPPC